MDYNPDTGIFTWKYKASKSVILGSIAGRSTATNNYVDISCGHRRYKAHRLAWILTYGLDNQPEYLDHIDTVKYHNMITNLRIANTEENMRNTGKNKRNSTGYKNVTFDRKKQKYMVVLTVDRKNKFIGYYNTPEEANLAAIAARVKYHGDFCHH